jgi:hypothetical protein
MDVRRTQNSGVSAQRTYDPWDYQRLLDTVWGVVPPRAGSRGAAGPPRWPVALGASRVLCRVAGFVAGGSGAPAWATWVLRAVCKATAAAACPRNLALAAGVPRGPCLTAVLAADAAGVPPWLKLAGSTGVWVAPVPEPFSPTPGPAWVVAQQGTQRAFLHVAAGAVVAVLSVGRCRPVPGAAGPVRWTSRVSASTGALRLELWVGQATTPWTVIAMGTPVAD